MTRRANGEGAIRKRADGRWEGMLHFRLPDGTLKEKAVYGKSQKECREKFDLLKGRWRRG